MWPKQGSHYYAAAALGVIAQKRRVLRCHLKESHYAKFLFG
jgi:hypothetical protein